MSCVKVTCISKLWRYESLYSVWLLYTWYMFEHYINTNMRLWKWIHRIEVWCKYVCKYIIIIFIGSVLFCCRATSKWNQRKRSMIIIRWSLKICSLTIEYDLYSFQSGMRITVRIQESISRLNSIAANHKMKKSCSSFIMLVF